MNILQGNLIYLRPIQITDVNETYLNWINSPEINFGLVTRSATMEELKQYVQKKIETPNCYFFAICDKNTSKHIGNIKLDFYDPSAKVIELGILIGEKNYWGKGIGYEAGKLVIDYAFSNLDIRKIWAAVYSNNPASKRMFEKLGFKIEGIQKEHICINGQYLDKLLMAIFKQEWQQKQ